VLTNLYRAHAIGWEVLKERGAGIVASINALTEVVPADPSSDADVGLATMLDTFQNGLAIEGHRSGVLPWPVGPVEVPGLRGTADLFGANWCAGITADAKAPFDYATHVPPGESCRSQLGQAPWADGFHRLLLRLRDTRLGIPLLVTENGLGTGDDAFRIAFLRDHLDALARAIAAGAAARGYLH
jgi:beta-glucosidase